MKKIYILLGSNIGNREHYIQQAEKLIENTLGTIVLSSLLYETAAWGNLTQGDFLNKVAVVKSEKEPGEVIKELLAIEESLGRVRKVKWAPREIDLDILFIDDLVISEDHLKVPHPHLHERRFVLVPLAEIAGEKIHPVLKKSISQLLLECTDTGDVKSYTTLNN